MATGNENLASTNYPSFAVKDIAGKSDRIIIMARAVPGYGMVMTVAEILASSGVDAYQAFCTSGGAAMVSIGDIKSFV